MSQTKNTRPAPQFNSQLWQSLEAFQIDQPDAKLTFVRRLAQENRWKLRFAERVFVEYKRFLYLAAAADHPASPPDAVDQAWHLHLAYTRSYWDELCSKLLKQQLHHLPTLGGSAEDDKHSDLYARTLESYEQAFGHRPPADIWPAANQGPVSEEKFARIRSSDYWMIKRPGLRFRKTVVAAALISVFGATMAACSSESGGSPLPLFFIGGIIAAAIYAFRNVIKNARGNSDCSSHSSCSSSCSSSGSGFFSFFSSCSSDSTSDSSSSCSSDSGSGGDSSCSSSSCSSSCSSCSSD